MAAPAAISFDSPPQLTLSSAPSDRPASARPREQTDGSIRGTAAYTGVDRRQRSQALSGRRLATAVCAIAPRRSRALLRGVAVRSLLVGHPLRRYLPGRARP